MFSFKSTFDLVVSVADVFFFLVGLFSRAFDIQRLYPFNCPSQQVNKKIVLIFRLMHLTLESLMSLMKSEKFPQNFQSDILRDHKSDYRVYFLNS